MKKRNILIMLGVFLALALVGHQRAEALQADSNVNVGATVLGSCTITAGTDLSFSDYTAGGSEVTGSTDVSVDCTDGTPYDVSIDPGLNNSSGRRMTDGTNFLTYELYTDGTYGTVWDTTNVVSATGTSSATAHTVYGRIDASQTVPPGNYQDTVQVSVVW